VRNVARVVEYPSANFGDTMFPIYGLLGVARVDRLSVSIDQLQLQTAAAYTVEIDKQLFFGDKIRKRFPKTGLSYNCCSPSLEHCE